jgi:hypothetical protein
MSKTKESDRKEKIKAVMRLQDLEAGVDVSLHPTIEEYEEAYGEVEQERYDEIKKNREILGLGNAPEHIGIPDPAAKAKARAEEKKAADARNHPGSVPPGKGVQTTTHA